MRCLMPVLDSKMDTVRPFVILSSQRSGSTFVRIWLNQHSKIHSYGEVFIGHYELADGFRAYCWQNGRSKWLFKIGHSRVIKGLRMSVIPKYLVQKYLNELYLGKTHPAPWTDITDRVSAVQPRQEKPVIGFKVMYDTLAQYGSLDGWLMEEKPRVIHLTRNNLLRRYCSIVRKSVTRIAHTEDKLNAKKKVYIDTETFVEFAKTQMGLVKEYRNRLMGQMPYLELSYEDFFADTASSKKAILDFLEVEDEDMPFHNMKKIGSTQLSDDIENWDEVFERLSDTPNAIFLESP